jgi:hypothetical protein
VLWKKNEVCFLHRKKIIRNMKWRGSEKWLGDSTNYLRDTANILRV